MKPPGILPRKTLSRIKLDQRGENSRKRIKTLQTESRNENSAPKKELVIILGDSMTYNIQGRKLSKKKYVVSKSFSSCTVGDMFDFVKPSIRRKPNKIILHVGTNNLSTKQLGEKIIDLARFVEHESPLTKLAVSSLTVRKDDINNKVKSVNKFL